MTSLTPAGGHALAVHAERRTAWADLAGRYLTSLMGRTRETYASDLADLTAWADARGLDRLDLDRALAYILDPPHLDRVLEHAVAPSTVLDRAQALAAFAHLLTARRRHATPPPGDAVLAALEHRLERPLTLRELDLLDALPVSVTLTSLDAANAAADDGDRLPGLACSTGRP